MVALVQSLHNKRLQRRIQYSSTERAASKEEEHWAFSDEEGALSIHRREGALSVHRRGGALSAQLARRRSTGRSAVKEDCSTALSEAETVLKEGEEF